MTVRELMNLLIGLDPELPVCIDVDDGVKANYLDVKRVRKIEHAEGPFIVIDTDAI